MEERLYQMKEFMEKVGTTRDTLKYYEKKGLIVPKRNDSGYRVYDETDVQKMKMILDLKELGFSLDDISSQMAGEGAEHAFVVIDKLREETEQTITELHDRLKKLQMYETWRIIGSRLYKEHFQVECDYRICYGCYRISPKSAGNYYIRDLQILHLSDENEILNIEEKIGVLPGDALKINEACQGCSKEKMLYFEKVYSGVWYRCGGESLGNFLKKVYKEAERLGYQLQKVVYCEKKMGKKDGRECIAFSINIPFESISNKS